jgi:CRAL/TRIO domain
LNGLSTSQLSRRALAIIKEQSAIDSICFPETMSYMLIINAPTFFSATWRLIKGWLDPRTVGKIEVISSKAAGEKRMLELIDNEQLPADYGGAGPDTNDTLAKGETFEGDAVTRLETKMLYLRGHGSEHVSVHAGESLQVTVFTRSTAGATFSLHCEESKKTINGIENVLVQHAGTDDPAEKPTEKHLNTAHIKGPMKIKVKADSKAGRFSTQNFLVVFSYYKE